MGIEERLQVLEEETQIVRGELKQTLVNVRDFLLELNLPAIQEEEQREIHEHNETHEKENAHDTPPAMNQPSPMPPQAAPASGMVPAEAQFPPVPQAVNQAAPPSISQITTIGQQDLGGPPPPTSFGTEIIEDLQPVPESYNEPCDRPKQTAPPMDTTPPEPLGTTEEEITPTPQQYVDDVPMGFSEPYEETVPEVAIEMSEEPYETTETPEPVAPVLPKPKPEQTMKPVIDYSSQINLLTNLIRWVTAARKEIGIDYLPAFLDVYGIGDRLSAEIREVIMYLATTISPKPLQSDPGISVLPEKEEQSTESLDTLEKTAEAEDISARVAAAFSEPARSGIEPNGEIWNRMILELHGILRCSTSVCFEDSQLPWKRADASQTQPQAPEANTEEVISNDIPDTEQEVEAVGSMTGPEMNSAMEAVEPDDTTEEESPDLPEDPVTVLEEVKELETPKKKVSGRSRNARKKQPDQESSGARLKLVIPVGDDQETEIEIGAFNLSLNRAGDTDR